MGLSRHTVEADDHLGRRDEIDNRLIGVPGNNDPGPSVLEDRSNLLGRSAWVDGTYIFPAASAASAPTIGGMSPLASTTAGSDRAPTASMTA